VDGSGNVYIVDYVKTGSWNVAVFKEDLADPPTLSFDSTAPGSTSADSPQTVTISNFGNAVLNFSEVGYPVDFPQSTSATGDCTSSTSLAAGESCALTIDFEPVTPLNGNTFLALSGSVTVTTNTLNTTATPQTLTVTGTETNQVAVAPVFSVPAGTYTTAQTVTIIDSTPQAAIYYTTDGTKPTASSTVYSGPISVSSTETLQAMAMAPDYIASAVATATYTIPPDFSLAVSPSSLTVESGLTGTETVTITQLYGFNSIPALSCSAGLPSNVLCDFSLGTETAPGVIVFTLTVKAYSASAALHRASNPWFPGSALAVALGCFGWRKRRRLQLFLLLVVSAAGLSLFSGCGGGGSSVAPPQPVTSTVTVTATSGILQHTAAFSLTVN
jgi:hypothetical protein